MNTAHTKVVAVTESVATAGAIIWWRLNGTVDHEELCAAWADAGLPEKLTPSSPSAARALTRAMNELQDRTHIVRPLPKGGLALVQETADTEANDLGHAVLLTAELDANGDVKMLFKGEDPAGGMALPDPSNIRKRLFSAFGKHRLALSTTDISEWLAVVVHKHLDAVSLRDKGGIYFVPATSMEEWAKIVKVLREVSGHFIAEIPAMKSAEAVAAILDAIEREAETEVARMMEELGDGALKKRALEGRVRLCQSLDAKVTSYEGLLGTHLDKLRERIEAVRAQMTVAIFQLDDTVTAEAVSA